MITYHIIQYSLLIIICTYLVNYYSAKTVSFHVKFWSIITWTLNFAITLLVPEDIYQTLNPSKPQNQQKISSLGWQYLALYWLVYLLTWTIIPVLQQWQNSGDLQSKDRMKRSLKVNGIFYLWMIVGAVLFLLILLLFNVASQMGLITFLKCLATIWGLLLLMGLMGYALAEIPKTLWLNAEPQNFLNYLYSKITQVDDELQQSYQQFTKVVGFILYTQKQINSIKNTLQRSIKNSVQNQIKQTQQKSIKTQQKQNPIKSLSEYNEILRYCQQSHRLIPVQYKDKINQKNYYQFLQKIQYLKDYPIGLQSSIQHLRLLKRTIAQCRRLQRTIDYYCKMAILYEDILNSINGNKIQEQVQMKRYKQNSLGQKLLQDQQIDTYSNNINVDIKHKSNNELKLQTKLFVCKWYHHIWYLSLRKHVNKLLALIIGTLALLLMIAQSQVFLTNDYSILRWLLRIQNYELLRIVVFIVIAFIMYMVNYSLFRLKVSNLYGLYYKDSDGPSLMFATVNFSRVGVVIVLNFFQMMKMDSEYERVMGTVNMGLLGEWIIKGLPGVLWLIVLTHFFNLWGKLMDLLKLSDSFGFDSHQIKANKSNIKKPHMINKKRQIIQKQFKLRNVIN